MSGSSLDPELLNLFEKQAESGEAKEKEVGSERSELAEWVTRLEKAYAQVISTAIEITDDYVQQRLTGTLNETYYEHGSSNYATLHPVTKTDKDELLIFASQHPLLGLTFQVKIIPFERGSFWTILIDSAGLPRAAYCFKSDGTVLIANDPKLPQLDPSQTTEIDLPDEPLKSIITRIEAANDQQLNQI